MSQKIWIVNIEGLKLMIIPIFFFNKLKIKLMNSE